MEIISSSDTENREGGSTAAPSLEPGPRCRMGSLLRSLQRRPYRLLAACLLLGLIGVGVWLAGVRLVGEHHLRSGKSALEKYHNAEALGHLQIYLDRFPDDAAALLLAARVARRLQAFDKAEQLLNRYRRLRGEDDGLFLERVLLRLELGDLAALKNPYQEMLTRELDRGDPNALLLVEALASGFIRSYRLQDAEKCLRLWLAKQPENTQALLFQGIVHQLKTHKVEAKAVFDLIVNLDPEHFDARMRLVDILLETNQAQEALAHVETLTRQRPENLMAQVYLARCQDQLGHEAEAQEFLDKVLAQEPKHAFALGERGTLAMRQGNLELAETCLRQARALAPGDFRFHYQYFLCLKNLGREDQAREADLQVKKIKDDLKRINDITVWEMQQRPHDADLHFEVGRISLAAGQEQEALRWFQSALREDPRHAKTHEALGEYYRMLGELGRAEMHRQQALEGKKAKN